MKSNDEKNGITSWPDPVDAEPYVDFISTNELDERQKEVLWRHLLKEHPEEAKRIKALSQSRVIDIVFRIFDAGFAIPKELAPPELWSELRTTRTPTNLAL